MADPSRAAWLFSNVTSVDTFWPELASVEITQENPSGVATLSCVVTLDGANAGLAFQVEHVVQATFGGTKIWAGHLKTVLESAKNETGPPTIMLSGQDYTAKLDDAIIRRRKKRKRERLKRRVKWILSALPGKWELAGKDLSGLPDENPYVEAYDYFGATVREALEHVADEQRLHFYIDFDNVFRIFRNEQEPAPFNLDNVAPDFVTTFPFREWTHEEDSGDMANVVWVEPEKRKDTQKEKDTASIAAYGRQERFISDSNLHGPAQATNMALRAIAQGAEPEQVSELVCWEPGLSPAQRVHVTEGNWSKDFYRLVQSVVITAVDPHDDDGKAYLKSHVTLVDNRRPKNRSRGPGSTSSGINKVIRGRPAATVDTGGYALDKYQRNVAPPTVSDGASIVANLNLEGYMSKGRTHGETPTDVAPAFTVPPVKGFGRGWIGSYLGSWYNGWTDRPSYTACVGVENAMTGYIESEVWYSLTVPAHPGNLAGIKLQVTCTEVFGYGALSGLQVVARSAKPTDTRQGAVIGTAGLGETVECIVPAEDVPAAGAKLWVGLRTAWETDAKDNPYDYSCGFSWPYQSSPYIPCSDGALYQGSSGKVSANTPNTALWQVWGASAPTLGALLDGGDAPWAGGNTIYDDGYEGAGDAWRMEAAGGGAFIAESEEPAGKGIYMVGAREDEDEPRGPWSDVSWAPEVTFSIDAHGSTVAAGQRHIEVVTTGEGERTAARIQLGDTEHAEGLYVAGPTSADYGAQAFLLNTRYVAKFDSRAGVLRGKVWREAAQEPAQWLVECAIDETEDEADRFSLWLRVGNGAGDSQKVTVHKLVAYEGANSGQRIVKEFIGYASGDDKTFPTAHNYRSASLRAYVNGIATKPQSRGTAKFTLDHWPTAGSRMSASYIVED